MRVALVREKSDRYTVIQKCQLIKETMNVGWHGRTVDGKNKVMNKGIQMVNKQTDKGLIERDLGLENREALFLSNELRVDSV